MATLPALQLSLRGHSSDTGPDPCATLTFATPALRNDFGGDRHRPSTGRDAKTGSSATRWDFPIGSVFGAAINSVLPPTLWTIGPGIMIAMFVSHLFSLPATAKLAGYVCAIVLLDHSNAPWSYSFFRLVETALGIGMAICVSFVPKLIQPNNKRGS